MFLLIYNIHFTANDFINLKYAWYNILTMFACIFFSFFFSFQLSTLIYCALQVQGPLHTFIYPTASSVALWSIPACQSFLTPLSLPHQSFHVRYFIITTIFSLFFFFRRRVLSRNLFRTIISPDISSADVECPKRSGVGVLVMVEAEGQDGRDGRWERCLGDGKSEGRK